jgi:hypothetical protein
MHDPEDDVGLGVGVGDAVIRPRGSCLTLGGYVSVAGVRVRPQVVAEQQMHALPFGSQGADVYMHVPRLSWEWTEVTVEVVAAAQLHAGPLKLWHVPRLVNEVRHLTWISMTGFAARPGTEVEPM